MKTAPFALLRAVSCAVILSSADAAANVFFIHTDHLDTPRVVSDLAGNKVWAADYDAFGKATITSNTLSPYASAMNVRFPGQYFDAETSTHYNYFRDYDPQIGRYFQSDPVGIILGESPAPIAKLAFNRRPTYFTELSGPEELSRGLNHLYAYVNNNPLRWIDPLGLYGTTNCDYYSQRCEDTGGWYYCDLAPWVCGNTPPGPWADCVRECLQEFDQGYCDSCNTDTECVMNIHQMCWQECVGGGPPVTRP